MVDLLCEEKIHGHQFVRTFYLERGRFLAQVAAVRLEIAAFEIVPI